MLDIAVAAPGEKKAFGNDSFRQSLDVRCQIIDAGAKAAVLAYGYIDGTNDSGVNLQGAFFQLYTCIDGVINEELTALFEKLLNRALE